MLTQSCSWLPASAHFHVFLSETGGKGAKAPGGGGGGGEDDELVPSRLDIRVGKVISVEKVSDFNCLDDANYIQL